MNWRTELTGLRRLLLGTGTLAGAVLLAALGQNAAAQQTPPGKTVLGVACSQIQELGIDKQANQRASAIRVGCGLEPAASPDAGSAEPAAAPALPGNVNTITGGEISPKVTQAESFVWSSDGQTIVVTMNDSRTSPNNYSGISVSTDGGVTFNRLNPSPFAAGHGTNFGDPVGVYNRKLAKWFSGWLATGCGGQGLGLWTSLDALTWSVGVCAHTGTNDDRESMWVDNNPTSPFYGRMYISWNNFAIGGGALQVIRSDDGTAWSAPVTVFGSFRRNVQLTGGPDGTVFLATMSEGGGGLAGPRQNFMYRSTDGGVTFGAAISMGAAFAAAGDALCSTNNYFSIINPIWRHMGWGQPGAGPNKVVHYVYAGKGVNATDTGDIYYVRSTDNGLTWSPPIVLNTDQAAGGTRTQWMPSLSVTAAGHVHAHWYDRRDTTNGTNYKKYGRQSRNNGLTWLPDEPVSTVLIPQPAQPDPNVQACFAGDYDYATALGNMHYATWTDGRVQVAAGVNQQDVFFAAVPAKPPLCCGDFNGDAKADILWRQNNGTLVEWLLNGTTITSIGSPGAPTTDWAVVGLGDFNADGSTDILWRNGVTGQVYLWFMNGLTILFEGSLDAAPGGWQVAGVGDFNGDAKADIVWRDANGDVAIWFVAGLTVTGKVPVASASLDWQIAGVADFDGNGNADVLWRNNDGTVWEWLMNGAIISSQGSPGSTGNDWQIAGVGDFNGDGKADILWRNNTSGDVYEWQLDGLGIIGGGTVATAIAGDWQIVGIGDFNGDIKSDVLWRHTSGVVYEWLLSGTSIIGGGTPSPGSAGNDWQIE